MGDREVDDDHVRLKSVVSVESVIIDPSLLISPTLSFLLPTSSLPRSPTSSVPSQATEPLSMRDLPTHSKGGGDIVFI